MLRDTRPQAVVSRGPHAAGGRAGIRSSVGATEPWVLGSPNPCSTGDCPGPMLPDCTLALTVATCLALVATSSVF